MKHLITEIAVRFPAEGEPTIELFTGKRQVGTVRFADQPPARAEVPEEVSEPFTLHFSTAMQGTVLDLLRSGEAVEFDRETGELAVAGLRARR